MAAKLESEYPDLFNFQAKDSFNWSLSASHTGDLIIVKNSCLDKDSKFNGFDQATDVFDALAMQVEEDLVYQGSQNEYKTDECQAIHLSQANGWSAEWAIGKSFDEIHMRVPRIKEIIRDTSKIIKSIVEAPFPTERIGAVNFRTSSALNRHPEIPEHIRHVPFHHEKNPNLFLRFERQTVSGFKKESAFLFTIKTYITQISPDMNKSKWESFKLCLEQSSEKSNPHKFIELNRIELEKWVDT